MGSEMCIRDRLHCLLGISSLRTTAYHPQAKGMVKRVHRVLKEHLMARSETPAWMEHLSLVLLGIRTSVRQDLDWCPAELVYGATLRLPGEFLFSPDSDTAMASPTTSFVARLRATLASMRPGPFSSSQISVSVFPGHSSVTGRRVPRVSARGCCQAALVSALRGPVPCAEKRTKDFYYLSCR